MEEGFPPEEPVDEVLLERLKNTCPAAQDAWIGDVEWLPTLVDKGGRPHFPRALLWVDRETELILHTEIVEPGTESGACPYNALLGLMRKEKKRPPQIILRFLPGAELFGHLEEKLGWESTFRATCL